MKFSLTSLREKDLKIVEKKKIFFFVPAVIAVVAIIVGMIFGLTTKSPFNLGMDFTGGYTITIKAGALINDSNYDEYSGKIKTAVEDFRFEHEGKEYGVEFEGIQRLGSGTETSLRVQYRAHKDLSGSSKTSVMDEFNTELIEVLNNFVGYMTPVSISLDRQEYLDIVADTIVTVVYDGPVKAYGEFGEAGGFKSMLAKANIVVSGDIEILKDNDGVYNTVKFTLSGEADEEEIKAAMTIDKYFSARALSGDMISGTVSTELIYSAVTAILVALLLMLGYIFLRFEFASGVAAIIALLHDIIIMFALMTIFHIEINATFIAALITILGYSINNTINVFERVREIRKSSLTAGGNDSASDVCNRAIRDVLPRCIYSSLTTLIMIGMIAVVCAIGGVTDMVSFSLPIIFGLISGAFSSICLAPSLWVLFKRNKLGTLKQPRENKNDTSEKNNAVKTNNNESVVQSAAETN